MQAAEPVGPWAPDQARAWWAQARHDLPDGFESVLILRQPGSGIYDPVAWHPPEQPQPDPLLVQVAERCAAQGGEVVEATPERQAMAVAWTLAGQPQGLLAVSCAAGQLDAHRDRVVRLAAEACGHVSALAPAAPDRWAGLMQAMMSALSQADGRSCAEALVTELAMALACDRVSLGFRQGLQTELLAISHVPEFRREMALVRQYTAVMDEAIDQASVLQWPAPADGHLAVREHGLLGGAQRCLLTVPFQCERGGLRQWGAMVFEREVSNPFTEAQVLDCRSACTVGAEIVALQRHAYRPWHRRWRDGAHRWLQRLRAPERHGLRLATAVLAVLLCAAPLAQGPYRVGVRAALEGEVVRAVVAPFDGYIEKAVLRAGDEVRTGTEIAALNRRDLQLELIRSMGQVQQFREQYNEFSARRDRAQMEIARAQFEQAAAQAQLIKDNLERAVIRAPFDGVIVSGDLHQQLGAGVSRGQTLFEVAPLNGYRVVLQVADTDIGAVTAGLPGRLRLTSLPDQVFEFEVARVTPVTLVRDGGTFFRVEAWLRGDAPALRPGMVGTAVIEAGTRPLYWIWLHPVLDWLRLHLWGGWQ